MREHSIADVAAACFTLAAGLAGSAPALAAAVLRALQRYVSWMDIGLVANDK